MKFFKVLNECESQYELILIEISPSCSVIFSVSVGLSLCASRRSPGVESYSEEENRAVCEYQTFLGSKSLKMDRCSQRSSQKYSVKCIWRTAFQYADKTFPIYLISKGPNNDSEISLAFEWPYNKSTYEDLSILSKKYGYVFNVNYIKKRTWKKTKNIVFIYFLLIILCQDLKICNIHICFGVHKWKFIH